MAERPIVPEQPRSTDLAAVGLVAGVVALTLATAYIHSTLGGWLFTLNAVGYVTLAVAILLPIRLFDQFRWLVRLALLGFTLLTIGGWVLFGARYDVAYLTKGIETVLVGLLIVSVYRFDGGPRGVLARLRGLPRELLGLVRGSR
jgi:hypothetical protein